MQQQTKSTYLCSSATVLPDFVLPGAAADMKMKPHPQPV